MKKPTSRDKTLLIVLYLSAAGYSLYHLAAGFVTGNAHWTMGGTALTAITAYLAAITLLHGKKYSKTKGRQASTTQSS